MKILILIMIIMNSSYADMWKGVDPRLKKCLIKAQDLSMKASNLQMKAKFSKRVKDRLAYEEAHELKVNKNKECMRLAHKIRAENESKKH